jgi:hypothetical protein
MALALNMALALSLALASRPARAQPVVRVEAQTRIELSTSRTEGGTRIRAVLLDDQGEAVAGAPLSIRIADGLGQQLAARPRAITGNDGAFEVVLPTVDERISVDARFGGDDYRSPVSAVELLDTRLARVELRFSAPASGVIDLLESAATVRVRARSPAGAEGLRIELADQVGSALGTATTDEEGVAEITFETRALGDAGPSKLIAHTHADGARAASSAELAIVRFLPSETSLTLTQAERTGIRARGAVRAKGRGVAGALIGLFTPRGDHVATLRADETGQYDDTFEPKQLGDRGARALELEARFESDAPWIGSSRSALARIELATPSSRYSWAGLALTPFLIALLMWWMSRRRWTVEPEPPAKERAEAGVALAQPKPRMVRLHHLACVVLDARSGRPVPGATLELAQGSEPSKHVRSDARGAIRIEQLTAGTYQLLFEAPGYRALRISVDAPHRGEWSGAHVRLESLRDAAVRAWSPLAQRLAAKPDQANAITVRETILRAAQSSTAQPSFAQEALQRAERAAYERRGPTDEEVQHVEHDASALLRSNATPRE